MPTLMPSSTQYARVRVGSRSAAAPTTRAPTIRVSRLTRSRSDPSNEGIGGSDAWRVAISGTTWLLTRSSLRRVGAP